MNTDDVENDMVQILQEEINKEILVETRVQDLLSRGWTRVVIDITDHDSIGTWMQTNISGDWRGFYNIWLFEYADDATLFKMRWA